jgi:hypothetical protein
VRVGERRRHDHQLAAARDPIVVFDTGGQVGQRPPVTQRRSQLIIEHNTGSTRTSVPSSVLTVFSCGIEIPGDNDAALGPLISIAVLALVVTAALWWIYFWPPHHTAITFFARSIRYGYVHYFVFAAGGAFSAGIEVEIDVLTHHSELSEVAASITVTVPIAVFVMGVCGSRYATTPTAWSTSRCRSGPSSSCSTRPSRSRSPSPR